MRRQQHLTDLRSLRRRPDGKVTSVVDTLGRTLTFEYNSENLLTTVVIPWLESPQAVTYEYDLERHDLTRVIRSAVPRIDDDGVVSIAPFIEEYEYDTHPDGWLPARVGRAGEDAVRAVAEIGPKTGFRVGGRWRVADGVTDTVLSEVKNCKKLSYSSQIRDYVTYCKSKGLKMELWTRSDTVFSKPLEQAIKAGLIRPRIIPGT